MPPENAPDDAPPAPRKGQRALLIKGPSKRDPNDDLLHEFADRMYQQRVSTNWIRELISMWRDDPDATYRSWFLWEERISIRRGLAQVVQEIEAGSFGNT